MAIPQNKADFTKFCMRKLGAPVQEINISEEQVQDCIDQAIFYFQEYHMDGQETTYFVYQLNNTDIANKYITIPPNIISVISMFPIGDALNTNSLFNMRYQFVINDLYNISNVSLIPYYMVMEHVQFLEQMLVGQQPIRFTRFKGICYIDMDWTTVTNGEFITSKCYAYVDPNLYPLMWQDKFLQEYATCLIKQQWGTNLKLFNAPLMGNVTYNGQRIYDEATAEKAVLEKQMLNSFSLAPAMMIN